MTMTDHDIEDRLRSTFRAVAAATTVDDHLVDVDRRPDRRRPVALAAAVLLVLASIGALLQLADREHGAGVTSTSPAPVQPLPPGLDLEHGAPVFGPRSTAESVAQAYVDSRFPDPEARAARLAPPVAAPGGATVRWSTGLATGTLLLVQSTKDGAPIDQWSLRAAMTDTVDASAVTHRHGRVTGRVSTTSPLELRATVLGLDGAVIDEVEGDRAVDLDASVGRVPALVRLQLLDGERPVSITEFRLDLSMPTDERELDRGSWPGGTWRLFGSGTDESEMRCWSLVLDGAHGGAGCGGGGQMPDRFVALAPVRRVGDEVLDFGQLGPDVARLVFRIPGRADVAVETSAHPDAEHERFALVALPAVAQVEVEAYDAEGRSLGSATFDPTNEQNRPLKLG